MEALIHTQSPFFIYHPSREHARDDGILQAATISGYGPCVHVKHDSTYTHKHALSEGGAMINEAIGPMSLRAFLESYYNDRHYQTLTLALYTPLMDSTHAWTQ